MLEDDRFVGVDAVVAVVAVVPCPAAAEHVARASLRRMTAEAVDIASLAILGRVIPVVPRIAVQEQVVRPTDVVDANCLPIVQAEPLKDVMASLALDADRLRMP